MIYSIGLQLLDLISNNNATTASIYIDMPCSALFQQIYHILEILHMPALIRAYGDALNILLNGAVYNLMNRAIVPQMNNLSSAALQDTPHDVDAGIMAVKKTGGSYKAYFMLRLIDPRTLIRTFFLLRG